MRFLFYISKKYSIPIVAPLVEYILTTPHQCGFFLSDKVARVLPDSWHGIHRFTTLDAAIQFHPDFVLAPGNFVDYRLPGKKIQLFHGLGVEKSSHYKIRHFFDCYCTSGPYVTRKFAALQKKYGYFVLLETGWPKVDYILHYPQKDLRRKLKIPAGKKVILYAPTFSKKLESATDLMDIIPSIAKEDEYWCVKFHELMDKATIRTFLQKGTNIHLIEDFDITPWLHVADVMLSDTSSVIYEMLLLDKPVVTYRTRSREDKGINITQPEQLRAALDTSLQNPAEFAAKRREHIAQINPDLSGEISKKLIRRLVEMAETNAFPTNSKPLNLFRKMQILYHQQFRKGYLR